MAFAAAVRCGFCLGPNKEGVRVMVMVGTSFTCEDPLSEIHVTEEVVLKTRLCTAPHPHAASPYLRPSAEDLVGLSWCHLPGPKRSSFNIVLSIAPPGGKHSRLLLQPPSTPFPRLTGHCTPPVRLLPPPPPPPVPFVLPIVYAIIFVREVLLQEGGALRCQHAGG